MKNLYHKNKDKGKVYPSPSFALPNTTQDALSVLNLLPVAILALASVLSLEDREVLGYLITRSMKTTTTPSSTLMEEKTKKCKKSNTTTTHKPLFDCGCFDCYTSYWFRWDSSPNRELIHQVIEAFEEYLNKGELLKNNNGRGKKKEKMGRRAIEKPPVIKSKKKSPVTPEKVVPPPKLPELEKNTCGFSKEDIIELDKAQNVEEKEEHRIEEMTGDQLTDEEVEIQQQLPANYNDNRVSRKAFPDVLGILNSRIWSLWNPNV